MTKTSTLVKFGLYNFDLNPLSTPSITEPVQPYSDITDLMSGDVLVTDYTATYEPDRWLLDGSYKRSSSHVGIVTLQMSEGNRLFASPPEIIIEFADPQTASGFVLHGDSHSNDYCDWFAISYYDESDLEISAKEYFPTDPDFSTGLPVTGFVKIHLRFYRTNKAYRYLRVSGVDYGELVYFDSDTIISATVVENVDPSGITLPTNSFELTVFSDTGKYSQMNPEGVYDNLRDRQPFDVYENVDADRIYIGRFYLDNWSNPSDKLATFQCVDSIHLLPGITFTMPGNLASFTMTQIGDRLTALTGFPVFVDSDVTYPVYVTGLPVNDDCRVMLQKTQLVAGVIITCSRSLGIRIMRSRVANLELSADFVLDPYDISYDKVPETRGLVTGVAAKGYFYFFSGPPFIEIYNSGSTLQPGFYTILLDPPTAYQSHVVTGATLVEKGGFFVSFTVTVASVVSVSAYRANLTIVDYKVDAPLKTGTKPNVLTLEDMPALWGYSDTSYALVPAYRCVHRVVNYYQQRQVLNAKLFSPFFGPGDSVDVSLSYSRTLRALIESQVLDLSGGFTADAKLVGGLL